MSNAPRISWLVNSLSDRWRHTVAFFSMVLGECSILTEQHIPIYIDTFLIRLPAANYATQKPDGNLTRLSPPV